MKYIDLNGAKASKVVLGCMRIAGKPLEQNEKLLETALSSGVNAFDHADIYGRGESERVFGAAMKNLKLMKNSLKELMICIVVHLNQNFTFWMKKN